MSDNEIQLSLSEAMPTNIEKQTVPEYKFNIFKNNSDIKIGEIGFRVCLTPQLSKFGGHIGYMIYESYRGHHYAEKAFSLLLNFIKKHRLTKLLITCGTNNLPSIRTIERMGAKLLKIEEAETDQKIMRPTCYYILNLS